MTSDTSLVKRIPTSSLKVIRWWYFYFLNKNRIIFQTGRRHKGIFCLTSIWIHQLGIIVLSVIRSGLCKLFFTQMIHQITSPAKDRSQLPRGNNPCSLKITIWKVEHWPIQPISPSGYERATLQQQSIENHPFFSKIIETSSSKLKSFTQACISFLLDWS